MPQVFGGKNPDWLKYILLLFPRTLQLCCSFLPFPPYISKSSLSEELLHYVGKDSPPFALLPLNSEEKEESPGRKDSTLPLEVEQGNLCQYLLPGTCKGNSNNPQDLKMVMPIA